MPTARRTQVVVDLPCVNPATGSLADADLDDADAIVVALVPGDDGPQPRDGVIDAAIRFGIDLGDLAERTGATGKVGDARTLHLPHPSGPTSLPWVGLPDRIVLVGLGETTVFDVRKAGASLARAVRGVASVVCAAVAGLGREHQQAFVEGYLLGSYRHPSAAKVSEPIDATSLTLLGVDAETIAAARLMARATWLARLLTVTPSNVKNPTWLAAQATDLAGGAGLEIEILDGRRLAGFGGLLAVGAGSVDGPRLVQISYRPAGVKDPRHVVVVGKGITFDTGGLSLKPNDSMVPMKTDMAGAAIALATVLGAAEAKVTSRVTALLALAENSVSGSSYRPSDVLTVRGGTTVEVTNTDAEGRLVLADALAHADLTLDPDVVIDVATLTGAATLALGRSHAALFTSDDALASELTAAGERSGERLWRMPLVDDYRAALDSDIADIHHVASHDFDGAGAITAALFLQRFAGRRRWAHLDIAGPARASAAKDENPEGATGFGARALLSWLLLAR